MRDIRRLLPLLPLLPLLLLLLMTEASAGVGGYRYIVAIVDAIGASLLPWRAPPC